MKVAAKQITLSSWDFKVYMIGTRIVARGGSLRSEEASLYDDRSLQIMWNIAGLPKAIKERMNFLEADT